MHAMIFGLFNYTVVHLCDAFPVHRQIHYHFFIRVKCTQKTQVAPEKVKENVKRKKEKKKKWNEIMFTSNQLYLLCTICPEVKCVLSGKREKEIMPKIKSNWNSSNAMPTKRQHPKGDLVGMFALLDGGSLRARARAFTFLFKS